MNFLKNFVPNGAENSAKIAAEIWKKRDNTLFLKIYSSGTRDVRWANGPQGMMKKSACQIYRSENNVGRLLWKILSHYQCLIVQNVQQERKRKFKQNMKQKLQKKKEAEMICQII